MGVDLGALVQKKELSLDSISGKKIAVDAHNAIYQFLSIIRQRDGTPLMDAKGRVTSHLSGLFYRNARLLEAGVKPVYVFDGIPPHFKQATIEERKEAKQEAEKKFQEARARGEFAEARKYAQATSRLTPEMVSESKQLLRFMGIPVVESPSEGEAQAAFMARKGTVHASASQDYDALLFGSPLLIRNLTLSGRRKLPGKNVFVEVVPELINLGESLSSLGLSQKQLVWIGLLVGTDFNSGVKGIGPKKALKLVKECASLEDAISKSAYSPEVDLRAVEDFFLNPPVSENQLDFPEPDAQAIIRFLCDEHSFSPERIEPTANSLAGAIKEKGAQKKLDSWV